MPSSFYYIALGEKMPIYEYRCSSCGAQKDVMQKINDVPLVTCPACQQATFTKQISAAGFQLKGSGWYATDFKNSGSKPQASTPAKAETPASTPTVVANT
jgi:putative FmdB family regulatory protein